MYQKKTFPKFPKKQKSKIVKESSLSTWERRMKDIKKLNGKHNGWWIYQFCMGEFNLNINKNKPKKRR